MLAKINSQKAINYSVKQIAILIVILLSSAIFSQAPNWTTIKETNVFTGTEFTQTDVDIFTNGYGNHVIIKRKTELKYFRMNANGIATDSAQIEDYTEGTPVVSPSISGDASNLYIVYRNYEATTLTAKVSTNGGSSWDYISQNPSNSNSSQIESVMSNGKLHVVYEVSGLIKYRSWNGTWSSEQPVSNSEIGYFPRIIAWYTGSIDRVYFLYDKANSNEGRWREFNVANNSWVTSSPQTAFTTSDYSSPTGFMVDNSYIFFYYAIGSTDHFFQYTIRRKTDNLHIDDSFAEPYNQTYKTFSTTTANNVSHTVFFSEGQLLDGVAEYGLNRAKGNGSGTSDIDLVFTNPYLSPIFEVLNISSSGNDVHVIWLDNLPGHNQYKLRYIYDDQAPLTPTNFTGTTYNNHPKLTWSLINGPDVVYEIHRKVSPLGEPAGTWQLLTDNVSASTSSYVDNGFEITGQHREGFVEYKMRAKDLQPIFSAFTGVVSYSYYGVNKINFGSVKEFSLSQNYPNPFNPSTVISYSIPFEGSVRLRVFNMLGETVSELVNQTQTAGEYQTTFDAGNLASGMYFYSIEAVSSDGSQNLKEVKKMLLQK
ncbi:MAG: T9SS type A sorting domain-containing protein [Ignavibacteriales bacterium]|nr:T9SS type A sorting domain-containing protein [Ignavibacteriales bacterium]